MGSHNLQVRGSKTQKYLLLVKIHFLLGLFQVKLEKGKLPNSRSHYQDPPQVQKADRDSIQQTLYHTELQLQQNQPAIDIPGNVSEKLSKICLWKDVSNIMKSGKQMKRSNSTKRNFKQYVLNIYRSINWNLCQLLGLDDIYAPLEYRLSKLSESSAQCLKEVNKPLLFLGLH